MGKWNEEAAPNNNLHPVEIKSSKLINSESDSKMKGIQSQNKKKGNIIF